MFSLVHVRDVVTVDAGFGDHVERLAASGTIPRGGTICLAGRIVRVTGPVFLNGWDVLIVADTVEGDGGRLTLAPYGKLDAAGVLVVCRRLVGMRAVLAGLGGGKGWPGDQGGDAPQEPRELSTSAGDCTGMLPQDCPNLPSFASSYAGSRGGPGGRGGQGEAGGAGGWLNARCVDVVVPPYADAPGGTGGPGGDGGSGGLGGPGDFVVVSWTQDGSEQSSAITGEHGTDGPAGLPGPPGPSGPAGGVVTAVVDENGWWAEALTELGDTARVWAEHRLAVAEHLFRAYVPDTVGRSANLDAARVELEAVRRLDPSNPGPDRVQAEIDAGHNALGLPRRLDVTPDFTRYVQAYTSWGELAFGRFDAAMRILLQAVDQQTTAEQIGLHQVEIANAARDARDGLEDRTFALEIAVREETAARARMADLQQKVSAATAAMADAEVSIGGLIGPIAAVAGAVIAMAGAVSTGGAALVALAPGLVAVTSSVVSVLPAIGHELLHADQPADYERIAKAYKDIDKEKVKKITEAGKSVVSLVEAADKLATAIGATPDQKPYLELVRQAAEAAQAALVARLRVEQADLARQNGARRVERASDLVDRAQQLAQSVGQTATELRAAAMTVVAIAQAQRDVLLGFGFRAQRSVEIYTLRDEAEGVLLDSGYLHPDRERDYTETYVGDAEIITFYEQAWGQFTYASRMQADYEAYFDGHDLGVTIRRFSFDDPAVVATFVAGRRIDFSVTPELLPADDLEAKIQNVAVALPGATSPSGIVTCEVTHGPVYRQRRVDGSTSVQVLAPHTATVTAPVTPLQLDGVDVSPGAPLTTPQTVPFWGRGVLGEWSVVVPESEIALHGVDTSTVTAVQVWIVYQFRRNG